MHKTQITVKILDIEFCVTYVQGSKLWLWWLHYVSTQAIVVTTGSDNDSRAQMLTTHGVVKYTVVCGQIKAADRKSGKTKVGTMPDFYGHLRHQMSRNASRTRRIFGILG